MRLTASSTCLEWPCAVSTTTRSTPASISRSVRSISGFADRGGGGDAQAALRVLAGERMGDGLFHVLDGDQADAAILIVDHQQLLDAMLVQHPLGLVLADALAHRDEVFVRHQLGDLLPRIGGKAHVAVGEDADELARRCRCRRRSPRECRRCRAPSSAPAHPTASRREPMVSGLTTMPDSNFFTCRTWAAWPSGSKLRWITPMPPACAMAIAMRASVTVSMAEAMIGMLSGMARVTRERISTSEGSTSDRPGFSSTSSNVNASRMPLKSLRHRQLLSLRPSGRDLLIWG